MNFSSKIVEQSIISCDLDKEKNVNLKNNKIKN